MIQSKETVRWRISERGIQSRLINNRQTFAATQIDPSRGRSGKDQPLRIRNIVFKIVSRIQICKTNVWLWPGNPIICIRIGNKDARRVFCIQFPRARIERREVVVNRPRRTRNLNLAEGGRLADIRIIVRQSADIDIQRVLEVCRVAGWDDEACAGIVRSDYRDVGVVVKGQAPLSQWPGCASLTYGHGSRIPGTLINLVLQGTQPGSIWIFSSTKKSKTFDEK